MIRALILGAAALAAALPAIAAEGGPILSGEHDGFSRLVLRIDPTTEWSLETAPGRATIVVPGKRLDFGTDAVFEKMPRERVRAVRSGAGDAGTTVEIELGCDCRVSTLFVHGRWLALDVTDRDAPRPSSAEIGPNPAYGPAPEDPVARAAREASVVSSAEQVLIQQIERAAGQGLIQLSRLPERAAPAADGAPPDMEAPAVPAAPEVTALPALPSREGERPAAREANLEGLPDHEQIEAVTVFDRDSHLAADRLLEAAVPLECVPDERLDVARWSNGTTFLDQVPALSARLVGEFDRPDPTVVAELVRLHIRFGLGAEAEWLLASFPAPVGDRALLADMARAVEGRAVALQGPLALAAACTGRHGLWLAAAGVAPVYHDAAHFASVQAAFAEMPPDLRTLLAPGLAGRLIDAGRSAEAHLILDIAAGPGLAPTPGLRLAAARLAAADGDPAAAVDALAALADANAPNATDALAHLVRLAVDAALPIPERLVSDLRAAAIQHRRTPREPELRALLAEALAHGGALGAAIAEIRAARRDLPEAAARFDALALSILADADPARVGGGAYAEVALSATDLLGPTRVADPARRAVAEHLLALGLPEAALETLGPAMPLGADARRIAAEAQLRLGRTDLARAMLAGLGDPAAADLRARTLARAGALPAAVVALEAAGLGDRAAAYAWPSGDWPRARTTAPGTERLAMASYMAARDGAAENPAPASSAGAEAFRAPLPRLDRPSLDAARHLLASARQVSGFVDDLLAEGAPPPPTDSLAPDPAAE